MILNINHKSELEGIISTYHINLSNNTKVFDNLWIDIQNKNCYMVVHNGLLKRMVHLVKLQILSPDQEYLLTETSWLIKNVIYSKRIQSIVKILPHGEEPINIAEKALKERLNIDLKLCTIHPLIFDKNQQNIFDILPYECLDYVELESTYIPFNYNVVISESEYKDSYKASYDNIIGNFEWERISS